MNESSPRVSVIVPAYSRVHFLEECLESIRSQTMPSFECIVVDDASPFGGQIRSAVDRLKDKRFRYLRRDENGGPAAARNTGIREARAPYFVCVDEDDTLLEVALERLVDELEATGMDAVCPQALIFGGMTGATSVKPPTLEDMLTRMHLLPNGWIMKRTAWESIGGYDEAPELRGRDDWEIWLRFLSAGFRIGVIRDSLYCFRVPEGGHGRPGSLEWKARLEEVRFVLYAIRKHEALYNRHPEIRRTKIIHALRREAHSHYAAGNPWRALSRAIQLVGYTRKGTDISAAGLYLIHAMLGEGAARLSQRAYRMLKAMVQRCAEELKP